MRWQIGRRSDNIEDRRGMSVADPGECDTFAAARR